MEALKALKPEKKSRSRINWRTFPKKKQKRKLMKLKMKWEEKIERKDLKYKTNIYIHDFQQFETIRSFGDLLAKLI